MSVREEDLIRRGQKENRMAFTGAVYECKLCGGKIDQGPDVPYEERSAKAAREHECQAP